MSLHLDWCDIKAAKYAVQKWHYSGSYTIFPCVTVGAWEDKQFVGAVIFARGANKHIGSPYGLTMYECNELVRVALSGKQESPTSQIVAGAVKMLRQKEPAIKLLVSYADPNQDHIGTLYQAMNWVYVGESPGGYVYKWTDGELYHQREVSKTGVRVGYGPNDLRVAPKKSECEKIWQDGKHKYLYPLDKAMRRQIEPLAKQYPKRADVGEIESRDDTIV